MNCKNVGCKEGFRWPMQLSRHSKKCKFPPPKKKYLKVDDGFHCSGCKKVFRHQSNIISHLLICKGINPTKNEFPRTKCSMTFPYECRLKKHLSTNKDLCCPKCQRKFRRTDHFDKHVDKCDADNIDKDLSAYNGESASSAFVCSTCNHCFVRKAYFQHQENCDTSKMIPSFVQAPFTRQEEEEKEECLDFSYDDSNNPAGLTTLLDISNIENLDPNISTSSMTQLDSDSNVPASSTTLLDISGIEIEPNLSTSSRKKYFKEHKDCKRKEKRLKNIIQSFSSPVKNKVVSKTACGQPKVLNDIFLSCSELQDSRNAKAVKAITDFF